MAELLSRTVTISPHASCAQVARLEAVEAQRTAGEEMAEQLASQLEAARVRSLLRAHVPS